MKAAEVRALTAVQLEEKLQELKAELFNLRFQHAINQLGNPQRIREVRRDIARVMTVMRQNESK